MDYRVIDLRDKTFDLIKVLSYSHRHKQSGNAYWNVECNCGTKFVAVGSRLNKGKTFACKSCTARINGRKGLYSRNNNNSKNLYMIRVGDYVKIGVSSDVERRLKDIASDNPYEITLLYNGAGEAQLEEMWHEIFSHRHHRGEWFFMPVALNCEL